MGNKGAKNKKKDLTVLTEVRHYFVRNIWSNFFFKGRNSILVEQHTLYQRRNFTLACRFFGLLSYF